MTAAQFSDLKIVAANLENGITTPNYVASIFSQLVDGSQANDSWTGGQTSTTTLGNLGVGTQPAQLNQLIGKWFLGTDMPDPTIPASSGQAAIYPTYQTFNDALFGSSGAPQITDVAQGDVGDCEVCSTMIEIAENNPGLIKSMIVSDGNGVYGVRFYVNGKETWVTVNDQLPTYQGSLVFNNAYVANQSNGLWADLIEKAYAQLSANGNIGHPAVNSYQNIAADTAFDVLTNLTDSSSVQYLLSSDPDWSSYKNIVTNAVEAHDDVILETATTTKGTFDSTGNKLLIEDHAYAVIGYDSATGDFIVRNPWGDTGVNQGYITQFEVSMSDVASVGGDFAFDNSAAPHVVLATAQQAAGLASLTYSYFTQAQATLGAGLNVALAPQIQEIDAAGLAVSQYMVQLIGNGTVQLNGATNIATAAQQAAGEIVVSAADLAKLTMMTGASGGAIELFVSGNDGTGWGAPSVLAWNLTSATMSILPTANAIAAQSVPVAVAGLFSLAGAANAASGLSYTISVEAGNGALHLNGGSDQTSVTASAASLSEVTFTPVTPGVAVLDVSVYNGTSFIDMEQVPVDVGYSVSATLLAYNKGETPNQVAVADSAANIFANLDALETMMPSWDLLGVLITDTTAPTESISLSQFIADQGVLSIIEGGYSLNVTGATLAQAQSLLGNSSNHVASVQIADSAADIFANLASLQTLAAAGRITGIGLTDANPVTEPLTAAAVEANATVLQEISGTYGLAVSGSAADIASDLGTLQSLAAAGHLAAITLTDSGVPNLTLTAAQATTDAGALAAITSVHTVTVQFSGAESQYTITTANGTVTVTSGGVTSTLSNVAALQFADQTDIVAQTPGSGAVTTGNVTELYSAVLAREPDVAGLAYYQNYLKGNPATPLLQFAEWFLSSSEYTSNAAHNYAQTTAGDAQFITDSYQNLLHRTPSASEVTFYQTNVMAPALAGLTPGTQAYANAESQAHAQMLVYFSASAEFLGDVQVTAANPASAQHWLILV